MNDDRLRRYYRAGDDLPAVRGKPAELSETLDRFLANMGAPIASTLTNLTSAWGEIVGPALEGPTRPIELVGGHLVVGCNDPGWASQIRWMDHQIKERFSARFPGETISRISTRVDR